LAWTGAENLAPIGIRSPDRPARSEWLYRLSYPGPVTSYAHWVSYLLDERLLHAFEAGLRCVELHSVGPSARRSVGLSVYRSVCQSPGRSVGLPVGLPVYRSVCRSTGRSAGLPVGLSVYRSVPSSTADRRPFYWTSLEPIPEYRNPEISERLLSAVFFNPTCTLASLQQLVL